MVIQNPEITRFAKEHRRLLRNFYVNVNIKQHNFKNYLAASKLADFYRINNILNSAIAGAVYHYNINNGNLKINSSKWAKEFYKLYIYSRETELIPEWRAKKAPSIEARELSMYLSINLF